MKEGPSREEAGVKMEEKMNSKDLNIFLERNGLIILFIRQLQNGPIHSEIVRDVKNFLSFVITIKHQSKQPYTKTALVWRMGGTRRTQTLKRITPTPTRSFQIAIFILSFLSNTVCTNKMITIKDQMKMIVAGFFFLS